MAALSTIDMAPSYPDVVSGCGVTDGDTIRCGGERIRLLGIDAPELAGHCRPGRNCAPGDGEASKRSLAAVLSARELRIRRVGKDHYGRTLAIVSAGGADLSCHQLKARQAIYRSDWDDGLYVARACPGDLVR